MHLTNTEQLKGVQERLYKLASSKRTIHSKRPLVRVGKGANSTHLDRERRESTDIASTTLTAGPHRTLRAGNTSPQLSTRPWRTSTRERAYHRILVRSNVLQWFRPSNQLMARSPRVVAIFHASFHPTKGNVVDWCLKASDGKQ